MIFRYYPQIHFYIHFLNKDFQKKFSDPKIISFSKADFQKFRYINDYTSFDQENNSKVELTFTRDL